MVKKLVGMAQRAVFRRVRSTPPLAHLLLLLLAVFAVWPATTASAQFVRLGHRRFFVPYGLNAWGGYGWGNPYYGSGYGRRRGYGYGRGYGMAGTPLSSAEFGAAQITGATGYANLQTSKAVQNDLQARSTDFNNRVAWTSDYQQMRRAHRASDAGRDRLSSDDVTKFAHDAAPRQLDATQADPATGKIQWPVILQDARYIETRDEIENLYRAHVVTNKLDAETYLAYHKSCQSLLASLKAHMSDYSANDYQQARHFIENLQTSAKTAAP